MHLCACVTFVIRLDWDDWWPEAEDITDVITSSEGRMSWSIGEGVMEPLKSNIDCWWKAFN